MGQGTAAARTLPDRRLDIQGLRALAVLMVMAFHARLPVPGGFVGVDVFFVISGYVITAMLVRELARNGRVDFRRFYLRRFKRLTPALALMLCVTMILAALLLSPLGTQQDAARTAIGAMLLGANYVIAKLSGDYFGLDAHSNALLNTWSLSVEEQFYLAFPLLLAIAWRLGRRWQRPWVVKAIVATVGVGSLALALGGSYGMTLPAEQWLIQFYSPLTRAWEFAAGSLLALLPNPWRSRRVSTALGVAGVLGLAASLVVINEYTPFPGPATLLPVVATMLLLLAGSGPGPTTRMLSSTPMARVGDWSYSLYLWHWPFIVIATSAWPGPAWVAPAAALASALPAIASYRWVEQPLRAYEPPHARAVVKLIGGTLVPTLLLTGGLWQAADNAFWNPDVVAFQSALFAQPQGCNRAEGLTPATLALCTRNADAKGRTIYLLGDSNAGHFVPALTQAALEVGSPLVINTTNSCPFLDVDLDRQGFVGGWNAWCRDYTRKALAFLDTRPPSIVIVSNIDTYWERNVYSIGSGLEPRSPDPQVKLQALRIGLLRMVERLESHGHQVLLVQTIPRWSQSDTWRTDGCNVFRILADRCDQSMAVASAEARQGAARTIYQDTATRTRAGLLDLWPVLCPLNVCRTLGPGYPLYYRDGIHLSVLESQSLAGVFANALRRL